MKKILCVIIMLIFFCLMFNTVCFANIDTSTSMNKISFDSSSVQRFVDNNLSDNQYLPSINIKKLIDEFLVSGSLNFNSHALIKGLIDFVLHEAVTSTFLMFELIAIAVLFALLKNLTLSYGDDGVNEIANYTCILIMAIIIIKSFVPVLNIAKNTINEMNELINIMLPPLISMVALSGGISSAATLDPIVVAAIKITTDLIHTIILPMTVFIVVLNIIDALSINIKVTKLASLIKEITLFILGFIMTGFIGILTVRSSMATSIDLVALKTTKFAVDTFVPVVGKCFSDAIAAVVSYSGLLKEVVSFIGLIVMVIICIFPLIKIAIIAFVYKFAGALMEPVIDARISNCISSVGTVISIIFASVLSVGVLFFILIAIIASSGKLMMIAR